MMFDGHVLSDVLSVFVSQKSFSLVLEALDYDNATAESGEAAVYRPSYLLVNRNVKKRQDY